MTAESRREDVSRAKNYAYRLLKIRLRSEAEMYDKLKGKGYPAVIIEECLNHLKAHGFINDHLFTQGWIESRLRKPLGWGRIRSELKKKGIGQDLIEQEIEKATRQDSGEILLLAKKRLRKYHGCDQQKKKRRLYQYLKYRGFENKIIYDVIKELFKCHADRE